MNSVNKTMYIPLYGKAYVSEKGLFLKDETAQKIWAQEGFSLWGKAKSKWLAYFMGIRSAVFDEWLRERLCEMPDAAVIHLGCGLDSRVLRVGTNNHCWYDVDFPEVISERRKYFTENEDYKMISADVRSGDWLNKISDTDSAIVVMEGVSMYLTAEETEALAENLSARFQKISLLADVYTVLAAKMSKYRNPVNEVGVSTVYGTDDPQIFEKDGLRFVKELEMTPHKYIEELQGIEKKIFEKLYAGSFSKRLYRLYEYRK